MTEIGMTKTLAQIRNALVYQIVANDVDVYLAALGEGEIPRRSCAYCGATFKPRSRWHFNCSSECRARFYGGQFHPRTDDKRRRRTA